jgi:hypothetical protein
MKRFFCLIFAITIFLFNLGFVVYADDDNTLPEALPRETYNAGTVDLSKYNKKVDDVTKDAYSYIVPIISLSAVIVAAMYIASPMSPNLKTNAKVALVGIMVGVILLLFYNQIGGFIEDITGVKFSTGEKAPTVQHNGPPAKVMPN